MKWNIADVATLTVVLMSSRDLMFAQGMAIAPRGLLSKFLEPRSGWSSGRGLFARQSAPACSLVPCVELAQRFQAVEGLNSSGLETQVGSLCQVETFKSAQECFNCVAKDFGKTPEVEKYMELVASNMNFGCKQLGAPVPSMSVPAGSVNLPVQTPGQVPSGNSTSTSSTQTLTAAPGAPTANPPSSGSPSAMIVSFTLPQWPLPQLLTWTPTAHLTTSTTTSTTYAPIETHRNSTQPSQPVNGTSETTATSTTAPLPTYTKGLPTITEETTTRQALTFPPEITTTSTYTTEAPVNTEGPVETDTQTQTEEEPHRDIQTADETETETDIHSLPTEGVEDRNPIIIERTATVTVFQTETVTTTLTSLPGAVETGDTSDTSDKHEAFDDSKPSQSD